MQLIQTCMVDACDKQPQASKLCKKHYDLQRNYKVIIGPRRKSLRTRGGVKCINQHCTRTGRALGACATHRRWIDITGSADISPSRIGVGRNTGDNSATYIVKRVPKDGEFYAGKIVKEHRLVMAHKLGRELYEFENVHHINGDPKDNHPDNLELWTTWQPPGQRLQDKIAWAKEILAVYEPEALKDGGQN